MAGNKRIRDNADNPDLRVEIGARIGNLRNAAGISQEELANLVGVSRQTITLWENASRDIKTTDIVRLADALGVSCDYILRGIPQLDADVSKINYLIHQVAEEKIGAAEKAIAELKSTVSSLAGFERDQSNTIRKVR